MTVPEATKQGPNAERDDIEIALMPKAGWAWRCWLCDINEFNLHSEDEATLAAERHVVRSPIHREEHTARVGPVPPERYHVKAKHGGDFETCWNCGRGRAVCKRKIAYVSWQDAEVAVRSLNEQRRYAEPITRYRCRWCLLWHVTHAKSKRRAARAEKQRRKWLVAQAVAS